MNSQSKFELLKHEILSYRLELDNYNERITTKKVIAKLNTIIKKVE